MKSGGGQPGSKRKFWWHRLHAPLRRNATDCCMKLLCMVFWLSFVFVFSTHSWQYIVICYRWLFDVFEIKDSLFPRDMDDLSNRVQELPGKVMTSVTGIAEKCSLQWCRLTSLLFTCCETCSRYISHISQTSCIPYENRMDTVGQCQ